MPSKKKNKSQLKILAVHRYYWPDTPPYASLLRKIVTQWSHQGHQVEVLSSQPSYKQDVENTVRDKNDSIDGIPVFRLSLPNEVGKPIQRVFNALKLGISLVSRAIWQRYDVIMISTSPPVLGGFFGALAAKITGARFIYHCMDIHPEIGKISGEFSHPLVYKSLSYLDNWACRHSSPIVVLSQDMKDSLVKRQSQKDYRVEIINNFSLPSESNNQQELPFSWPNAAVTLLFAGNIGRFQGLEIIIDAMKRLTHRQDIHIVMMGTGAAKENLEKSAKALNLNIHFVGHHSVHVAKLAMKKASIGFVSLTRDIYRYAYPSKTMTYLEQGCPILVAVESDSQLAGDVNAYGYGCTVEPGDGEALAQQLESLADGRLDVNKMKDSALVKAKESFSEEVILQDWEDLLLNKGKYQC